MVSYSQAIVNCFTYCKHFDFKGRSCRSEYWWAFIGRGLLQLFLTAFLFLFLISFINTGSEEVGLILCLSLMSIVFILNCYAEILMSIRRLHDLNMRGWWYLLFIFIIIPYVGVLVWIAWLVLFCTKGTTGPNRFGPDPLGGMQPVDTSSYQDNPSYQQAPQQYGTPTQPIEQPIQQGLSVGTGAPSEPLGQHTLSKDKDL